MAIQKDITDNKGVKTRYHKLDKFVACDDSITANIKSYTNASVRDAEKQAIDNNKRAIAYDAEIQTLRNKLDKAQTENVDGAKDDFVAQLVDEINKKEFDTARPRLVEVVERHYSEKEFKISYFEPITQEAIYNKLMEDYSEFEGGK